MILCVAYLCSSCGIRKGCQLHTCHGHGQSEAIRGVGPGISNQGRHPGGAQDPIGIESGLFCHQRSSRDGVHERETGRRRRRDDPASPVIREQYRHREFLGCGERRLRRLAPPILRSGLLVIRSSRPAAPGGSGSTDRADTRCKWRRKSRGRFRHKKYRTCSWILPSEPSQEVVRTSDPAISGESHHTACRISRSSTHLGELSCPGPAVSTCSSTCDQW